MWRICLQSSPALTERVEKIEADLETVKETVRHTQIQLEYEGLDLLRNPADWTFSTPADPLGPGPLPSPPASDATQPNLALMSEPFVIVPEQPTAGGGGAGGSGTMHPEVAAAVARETAVEYARARMVARAVERAHGIAIANPRTECAVRPIASTPPPNSPTAMPWPGYTPGNLPAADSQPLGEANEGAGMPDVGAVTSKDEGRQSPSLAPQLPRPPLGPLPRDPPGIPGTDSRTSTAGAGTSSWAPLAVVLLALLAACTPRFMPVPSDALPGASLGVSPGATPGATPGASPGASPGVLLMPSEASQFEASLFGPSLFDASLFGASPFGASPFDASLFDASLRPSEAATCSVDEAPPPWLALPAPKAIDWSAPSAPHTPHTPHTILFAGPVSHVVVPSVDAHGRSAPTLATIPEPPTASPTAILSACTEKSVLAESALSACMERSAQMESALDRAMSTMLDLEKRSAANEKRMVGVVEAVERRLNQTLRERNEARHELKECQHVRAESAQELSSCRATVEMERASTKESESEAASAIQALIERVDAKQDELGASEQVQAQLGQELTDCKAAASNTYWASWSDSFQQFLVLAVLAWVVYALSQRVDGLQRENGELAGTVDKTKEQLQATEIKLARKEEQVAGLQQGQRELRRENGELAGTMDKTKEQLQATEIKLARKEEQVTGLQQGQRELRRENGELAGTVDKTKEQLKATETKLARKEEQVAGLQQNKSELQHDKRELKREKTELREQATRAETLLASTQRDLQMKEEEIARLSAPPVQGVPVGNACKTAGFAAVATKGVAFAGGTCAVAGSLPAVAAVGLAAGGAYLAPWPGHGLTVPEQSTPVVERLLKAGECKRGYDMRASFRVQCAGLIAV